MHSIGNGSRSCRRTSNHNGGSVPVGAEDSHSRVAVTRREELGEVEIAPQERHHAEQLPRFQLHRRERLLQAERLAQGGHDEHDPASRVRSPGRNRGEDGAVPPGTLAIAKSQRHRVDRDAPDDEDREDGGATCTGQSVVGAPEPQASTCRPFPPPVAWSRAMERGGSCRSREGEAPSRYVLIATASHISGERRLAKLPRVRVRIM